LISCLNNLRQLILGEETMRKKIKRKQWKEKRIKAIIAFGSVSIILITVFSILFGNVFTKFNKKESVYTISKNTRLKGNYPEDLNLDVQLLTPNPYSRPQTKLDKVNGVVIHYTANPGTDAVANRNYFENLKTTQTTKASSHFVIGLYGEIVQCIPTSEISYASNNRNDDTISIEVCHPNETGKFTKESYDALVELVAWLACEHNLNSNDILRHYDVTGKICPKYFVEHEDKWNDFKGDVYQYIDDNKIK